MHIEAVLKKLRFRENIEAVVLNAPDDLLPHFKTAGFSTGFSKTKVAFTLLFARNKAELDTFLTQVAKQTEYDGLLSVAYPKGTSKIKSDINRDKLFNVFEDFELRPVSNVAIDETWSAIRYRPIAEVK